MHPAFREEILWDNRTSLERKLRAASRRRVRESDSPNTTEPVTLRLGGVDDEEALGRLAALNDLPAPKGPHVVAEIMGSVVAAMPVGRGLGFGDPFRPTAHLISLLQIWKKQFARRRRVSDSSVFRFAHRG
jgi:hypothetical protein